MLKRFGNFFLILIVIFSCDSDEDSIASSSPVAPITKNNVLLIIVDDIGLDATIGYNIGSQKPNMPNLQNLIMKNKPLQT
jgi:predicted AlkP superfamily pyrophosphatase or phosphodiesterase